ncbi:MAG TPA: peptide-N-glycosidase F-related protein [Myxococcota bacterium]|nr:peptide-N-glycosidase F-related protein [Myxococcota bacterium]
MSYPGVLVRWLVALALSVGCAREPAEPADTAPPGPCEQLGLPAAALDVEGPFDLGRGSRAEPFQVPTLDGPWALEDHWTGCDVYAFVPEEDESSLGFAATNWDDDHKALLKASPKNVHWFFFTDADDARARVKALRERFDAALGKLGDEEAAWWADRLHYVDKPVGDLRGVLAEQFARTRYGFLVDRDQRLRDVGSLGDPERFDNGVGWFAPNLSFAANEVVYANFLAERQARLDAEDATVVRVIDAENTGYAVRDVELPDAATLASFDHVDVDVAQMCDGGAREFGTCPAWDYLAYLDQCGVPAPAADRACQPRVPGEAPRDEVPGVCAAGGVATGAACTPAGGCGEGETCEGWQAADPGRPEVPAETRACACREPGGAEASHEQVCRDDGAGFNDCPCACVEIARWITTYHREGRWVWDATHALATLGAGGTQRLRYRGGNAYLSTVDLRFTRRDRGWGAPVERIPLFEGGAFDGAYNDGRRPISVRVPADAAHVELVVIVTGHGFGRDQANCAEFCNHTHHFTVAGHEHVVDQPYVGDDYGCVAQVAEGTVPNQFGTWFFGRGGWCPGKDVPPAVFDLDGEITPGEDVEIAYEGRLDGAPYVPVPANGDGFGARIDLDSFLLVWR